MPDSYTTPGGPGGHVTAGGPDMNENGNENVELQNGNSDNALSVGNVVMTVNATANDTKLMEMELRLNNLSEKILGLMERIQELTDRNQYLELSKLELITNTSNAMNDYRETVKRLNKQNSILITRIKSR